MPRRVWLVLPLVLATLAGAAPRAHQAAPPLRIFLRGGPKTHGPAGNGQHDGPTFVKEWPPLLTSRGAVVDAALTFPTGDQLDRTDVVVMFAANAGNIALADRVNLERFLKRGGGIVALHDSVLSDDPQWWKTIIGGAWENGVAKYFEGPNVYTYLDREHPIDTGAVDFVITDEIYWNLHLMPNIHTLASTAEPPQVPNRIEQLSLLAPQVWTYENQLPGGQPYRAVVSLLGHHWETFSSPHVRGIFLRAIAWAAYREVDSLATPEEIAALGHS